jgi:hypothetical protein
MGAKVPVPLRLRKDQVNRLNLLRAALSEKMGKEMTLGELLEVAIDLFLESK